MKNENPLEKVIEKCVCDYARSLGIMHYKFTSPAKRSVPDRIFFTPNGRTFLIEFKRFGEKPTAAQAVEIAKIKMQKIPVFVVDSVQDGKNVVDAQVAKWRDPMF